MVDLEATLRSALEGRYTLEHELGRGGMSVVYRAHDCRHNRPVAIKVLRPELSEQVGADRFHREVEFVATLTDPHILPLFDSGHAGGSLYYVMPFIEGGSLAQRLERDGPLGVEDAVHIARDVCRALAAAHEHGIVHRDIKPGNILFSGGDAVVADFGIAKAVEVEGSDSLTQSGLSIGSPAFMSPEQAAGDPVDGRADVYSLGCVLYAMLTGEPPFVRPTAQATIAAHIADPPPSTRQTRPEVPKGVDEIIRTALQKEPEDRFATSAEMVAALEHPELMPERAKALRRRRRARAASWALATVIGVVGIGYLAWQAYGPEPLPEADPNRVMVFPMLERGEVTPGHGLDAAIAIENVLTHADPLTFVDGWTWLDTAQRSDGSLVTAAVARRAALGQRARWYVTGMILGTGDSATVTLLLHDALADTTVAREAATGSSDFSGISDAGLDATTQLLPVLLEPGREIDRAVLAAARSSSPVAMLEWVKGEKEYRISHFEQALEHYESAIAADSSWAFAAFKGAQAASWTNQSEPALALVDLAVRHQARLPPKYRSFALGLQSYLRGQAPGAIEFFEAALALDSTWAEGWMGLGEVYYHLQPGWTGLEPRALDAFRTALRSDSSFVLPLYHLSEAALRDDDLDAASGYIDRFSAARPEPGMRLQLELMRRCVAGGPDAVDWATHAASSPDAVARAGLGLGTTDAQLDCREAALRSVVASAEASEDWKWGARFVLNNILVVRGRDGEASAIIDEASESRPGSVALRLVNAFSGASAFDSAASDLVRRLPRDLREVDPWYLWFLGSWFDRTGEQDSLRLVTDALLRRFESTGSEDLRMMALGMDARLAAAEGDTARALERLRTIHPYGRRMDLEWDFEKALPQERLLLARLLLARGAGEEAMAVAEGFELEPKVYLLYLPRSLEVRAEAARSQGDEARAAELEARLRALGAAREEETR